METLLIVIGVVMIIEGIPYFTMPDQVKNVAARIITMESKTLRLIGFSLMVGGLITVAIVRLW